MYDCMSPHMVMSTILTHLTVIQPIIESRLLYKFTPLYLNKQTP